MQSAFEYLQPRSGFRALAAALTIAGSLVSLSGGPVLGQPQTGQTLAEGLVATCPAFTWQLVEMAFAREVPEVMACRDAMLDTFEAAVAMPAADQELVGVGFADMLRQPPEPGAPAPFAAVTITFTTELDRWVGVYCTPAGLTFGAMGTLETCTAAARILVVASQALPEDAVPVTANTICAGISTGPTEWRTAVIAVVDDLAARAATGADPVMQDRIDAMVAGIARCR